MELKELSQKLLNMLGCEIGSLTESLRTVSISSNQEVFDRYVELVGGDLRTDYLQQIFQYYMADRKEKCQDFTPKSIAKLVSALTENHNVVYDCCAGSGALTIQKWTQCPNAEFICEELDENAIPYLIFNMRVRNMRGWVIHRDVLQMKTTAVYKIDYGEKYSTVEIQNFAPSISAGVIISNPPYNIPWNAPQPLFADKRFSVCDIPPKSNANFAFVLTALSRLSKNGKCAFILPCGVLTKSDERGIRKYLIDTGLLESVIALPDRMFESTSIPVCVLLFSHGNQGVKMFDCRERGTAEMREQNGQYGGASHEGRTYKKEINALSDDLILNLSGKYLGDTTGFCKFVPPEELEKNDYILTPSRYIGVPSENGPHRDFVQIIDDINRICRERNIIKITANETVARALGLSEIYDLEQQSNKTTDEIQKTFALFGKSAIKSEYLTLSKNKNELKIENKDKELFSSLLSIVLPMWKQHMFYLNQEENRLLTELRDALLPELMLGKIRI